MKRENQIKEIAKIDGWHTRFDEIRNVSLYSPNGEPRGYAFDSEIIAFALVCSDYLTSREAIIPVIQKQLIEIRKQTVCLLSDIFYGNKDEHNQWTDMQSLACLFATAEQLAEAFLKAMGKWVED